MSSPTSSTGPSNPDGTGAGSRSPANFASNTDTAGTRGTTAQRITAGLQPRTWTVESTDEARNGDGLEPTAWPSATVAPMELSVGYPVSGVSVIEIAGELDALTTPLLDECLREQLQAGPTNLVIDLTEVTFLGSSGMAALVRCSRELNASGSGHRVHLTGTGHRAIRRPLELVGLLPLFSIHDTQEDALAQIASGADGATPSPSS